MVRLKANWFNLSNVYMFQFQFQNGAVKRGTPICFVKLRDGFQFQNGAVKSFEQFGFRIPFFVISIPKWCG